MKADGCVPSAGADIDAVGFVFLQQIAASSLYNVTYSGIPTNQACPTVSHASVPLACLTDVQHAANACLEEWCMFCCFGQQTLSLIIWFRPSIGDAERSSDDFYS